MIMREMLWLFWCLVGINSFGSGELQQIPLDAVKVGGEIGRRITITIYNNCMVLDIDGVFLKPFREKKACDDFIGLGNTIDAFIKLAKYTNDPKVIERKNYIVKTALECQEPDGYIGFFKPDCRVLNLWDVHEMGYIIFGLLSEYSFFGNEQALSSAKKIGDYLIEKMHPYPQGRVPNTEVVCWDMATNGLEDAMLGLYEVTKDEKYLEFVKSYMDLPKWDKPIVIGRWGKIEGHVYTYIKKCLEKERLNSMEPDDNLLVPSKRVIDFLLKENGLVIIGTAGQHECWHNTQEGIANLGETCATAYLIRWWNGLLRRTGDSRYGDLIERAIYNALFGAQSPDGRKIRYYTPFEGERVYFDRDDYCCPCNFRRIIAELPQMIYYVGEKGVYVNLYTDSETGVVYNGVKVSVSQSTKYPSDGKVKIGVSPEKESRFLLFLRAPLWCKEYSVKVNGEEIKVGNVKGGSWIEIDREWKSGDVVELELGMRIRYIKGVEAQAGRCALMYGPIVFCASALRNPFLKQVPVRGITIDLNTVEGPFRDDSIRNEGMMLRVKGWRTTSWYPHAGYDYDEIVLTEFPDPDGVLTYFHIPNPEDPLLEGDELMGLELPVK